MKSSDCPAQADAHLDIDPVLGEKIATLQRYAWLYDSQRFAGAGDIVRDFLNLPKDFVLPITFPHGVDTHNLGAVEDLGRIEPIYLAVRRDIAEAAEREKIALRFPHPWLMLPPPEETVDGAGTLFVAPPSGADNNQNLFEAASRSGLPRPWGISLKYRGLDPGDSNWWQERGFEPLSAGPPMNRHFYMNQRGIIARFKVVALAYPSSMATFAAFLGKPIIALPDVKIWFVGSRQSLPFYKLESNQLVTRTWNALLGSDRHHAKNMALELLGAPFLASKQELRTRLLDALRTVDSPVHLPGVRSRAFRSMLMGLLGRGFPAQKLLPNPIAAGTRKLCHLFNCNRPCLFEARLLAHYGIVGDPEGSFRHRRVWGFQVGRGLGLGEGPKKCIDRGSAAENAA
jgi:hypothetical protein